MVEIPERVAYLLKWETKAFTFLALSLKDGSPQVTPLWFDWDGTHLIVNTARGRVKDRVMHRKARVALAIPDPADAYKYVQIRGTVVAETEAGGFETICRLNEKYRGKYEFTSAPPGQVRVTYKILPEQVFTNIK
jgi:PPOX class probable F420-dependent enzyme